MHKIDSFPGVTRKAAKNIQQIDRLLDGTFNTIQNLFSTPVNPEFFSKGIFRSDFFL